MATLLLLLTSGGALDPKLNRGRDKVAADFALSIKGMTTPHCVSRVRAALQEVPGVKAAEVMLPGSALIVGTCSKQALLEAVASAGSGFTALVEAEKKVDSSSPEKPMSEDAQRVSEAYASPGGRASLITDTSFAGSAVVELSGSNFRETVAFGEDLWLVFFYFHDRCALCHLRGEEIKKAAELLEGTGVRIGAIDVDERGGAAALLSRIRVTGTDLKNLGKTEQREGLPRPGPAPLIKVFNVTQKITARRGIYEAPDLAHDIPVQAEIIVDWASETLLAGRTAQQLATELGQGTPLLARLDSGAVVDALQHVDLRATFEQLQEFVLAQVYEGKPTPVLIGSTCLVTYILLSCALQFSLWRQRATDKVASEQQQKEREAFERKEREAMAAARAKHAQERAELQARKEQLAAKAVAQKKAEAARKKAAVAKGRHDAIVNMQSTADRRAAMQEKIQRMSKATDK